MQEADVGALVHSQVAIAPVAYAQQVGGMTGRVTRVFVQVQPGREAEVRAGLARLAAAWHLNLEPADFDATLFAVASTPAQQSEGLFSVISAIVGFLFAFNAMLLTVPERRRLIEAMRRRGATRRMTVQALMFDALRHRRAGMRARALGRRGPVDRGVPLRSPATCPSRSRSARRGS